MLFLSRFCTHGGGAAALSAFAASMYGCKSSGSKILCTTLPDVSLVRVAISILSVEREVSMALLSTLTNSGMACMQVAGTAAKFTIADFAKYCCLLLHLPLPPFLGPLPGCLSLSVLFSLKCRDAGTNALSQRKWKDIHIDNSPWAQPLASGFSPLLGGTGFLLGPLHGSLHPSGPPRLFSTHTSPLALLSFCPFAGPISGSGDSVTHPTGQTLTKSP